MFGETSGSPLDPLGLLRVPGAIAELVGGLDRSSAATEAGADGTSALRDEIAQLHPTLAQLVDEVKGLRADVSRLRENLEHFQDSVPGLSPPPA